MRTFLGCLLVMALGGWLAADDKKDEKIDPAKLLGKWTTKERADDVLEFLKDGKLVMRHTEGGTETTFDGTYKVEGNKLSVTAKPNGKEDSSTVTIKKLTDTEMLVISETGKEVLMVRVKNR